MRRTVIVLAAAAAVVAPARGRAQDPAPPPPSGIYVPAADGAGERRVPSLTTTDVETKGIAMSMLTQGLSKPKHVARFPGAQAGFTIADATPTFVFRFPPPVNPRDQMAMMEVMGDPDALPIMSTNPRQFTLVQVTVDGDEREIDTGALRKLKLKISETSRREFRVTAGDPLGPGEYAFYLSDARHGGGMPAQIWAFSRR